MSCDALFFVTSLKTRNVSLFIILVRLQKLISGSVFRMLDSPQFVLCSEWLTSGTKGFSHPQPYCNLNYITKRFYKHPCRHETWAQCWSSVDPLSSMLAQRWTGVVLNVSSLLACLSGHLCNTLFISMSWRTGYIDPVLANVGPVDAGPHWTTIGSMCRIFWVPTRRGGLVRCWGKVWPASMMLEQHCASAGQTSV